MAVEEIKGKTPDPDADKLVKMQEKLDKMEQFFKAVNPTVDLGATTKEADPEEKLIIKETKVDPYNTFRERVKFEACMCDECAEDMMEVGKEKNPYYGKKYSELKDADKKVLSSMLFEHKQVYHSKETQRIVSRKELPTYWDGRPVIQTERG